MDEAQVNPDFLIAIPLFNLMKVRSVDLKKNSNIFVLFQLTSSRCCETTFFDIPILNLHSSSVNMEVGDPRYVR